MVWNITRQATDDDHRRLERSAKWFCMRHKIDFYNDDWQSAIEYECGDGGTECEKRIARLWRACVRRAIQDHNADGIYCGTVGCWVE